MAPLVVGTAAFFPLLSMGLLPYHLLCYRCYRGCCTHAMVLMHRPESAWHCSVVLALLLMTGVNPGCSRKFCRRVVSYGMVGWRWL